MNKKFLSAILFGALMVTSTGTFVSCKDYDDDIDNLQGQITANADAIKSLQELVNGGDYVTGVEKTDAGIVFTFSKSGSKTITLDTAEDHGQVFELKNGEIYVDGKATGIKPAADAEKAPVKAVDGVWEFLNANGEYQSTGIPVSGVTVVGSQADGFTLTIVDKDGKSTEVKVPSAASLITSIVLKNDASTNGFVISKATFTKPSKWAGKKELPADKSVVYSSSTIDIRVNPVDAPATEAKYYLTNTKNQTLSNIALDAEAESADDAITIGGINGRAANTGNGLFTLSMKQYILSKDDAKAFDKELTDNAKARDMDNTGVTDFNDCVAFAVNANNKARSAYNLPIGTKVAADLTKIQVKDMASSEVTLAATTSNLAKKEITVVVGKTYTIKEIADEAGLMYDMYFSLAEVDKKTYGVTYDDLTHTFTVANNPDVSTAATGFDLTINTLSTKGQVKKAVYTVKLSSAIETPSTYEAITYDVAKLKDNDAFTLDMDIMKTALGDKWAQWANTVKLDKTAFAIYEKADCSDTPKTVGTTNDGLKISLTASDKTTAATVNNLKYVVVKVNAKNADGLKLDKQYYLKVTFKDKVGTAEVNNIVVPVTFTAPSVASQFELKPGYVVDGTINAYYYDLTEATKKNIALSRYFAKSDANAVVALDTEKEVKAKDNHSYRSGGLATLSEATMAGNVTLNASATDKDGGNAVAPDATTGKEFGYGETLTVKATNDKYSDTGWTYSTDSKKAYSFTIKIMSPIMEGTVKPVEGSTIKISANSTKGFDITKAMITGVDYNKNPYNVVPDKDVTSDPTNQVDNTVKAWDNEQIANVYVTKKGDDNTYIKDITLIGQKAKTAAAAAVAGAINVKADPLPNEQETAIIVNVKDAWGYTISEEVSVTILKN